VAPAVAVLRRLRAVRAHAGGDLQSAKDLQQLVIGPAGSTAVAGITTRVLDDLLFGRTTPLEAARSWLEEAEGAIA
jgi:multiple sugar transport system substrate-binding protein